MASGELMDDKKRVRADGELEEPERKRPLLDDAGRRESSAGPLGPLTLENIQEFQKEAIFRQMQAYKREKETLESRFNKVDKDYKKLQSRFSLLDRWWDQVVLTLKGVAKVGTSEVLDALLLKSLESGEDSEFEELLQSKNKLIIDALSGDSQTQSSELQETVAKLGADISRIRSENDGLRLNRDSLQESLREVTDKYLATAKKLERLESPVLKSVLGSSSAAAESDSPAGDRQATPAGSEAGKAEGGVSSEELEEAKNALEESRAVVAKQKEQLALQEEKIQGLSESLRNLELKLVNPSENDLRGSELYNNLKAQNADLQQQNSALDAKTAALAAEKAKILVGQESFEARVKEDYEAKKEDLEAKLDRAERDVARIRSARDELLSELNVKKAAELDKQKGMEHLKELVSISESRIKDLEAEKKRMQEAAGDDVQTMNLDGASEEDLKALIQKLQRQNKNLAAEIPGLEQAFAKAHAKASSKVFEYVDREAKSARLQAEKAKADERYFSAMRAKDALQAELAKVKSQLSKGSELIQQLKESERHKSSQISNLQQQIADLNRANSELERSNQTAKTRITERDNRLASANHMVDKLKDELRGKDGEIKAAVESKRDLEVEVEKLRRQVETKRLTSGGAGGASAEQLDALRSIALCSVCSKNWKDTAIKVCGHVFCSDCIMDRLNVRFRKCPACNKQFSHNDLLSVHL